MQPFSLKIITQYTKELNLQGNLLTIGQVYSHAFFCSKIFKWQNLNIIPVNDIPNTIIGDITDCRKIIKDNTYDFICCDDTFEHIKKPWLAAEEIHRIMKPGGVVIIVTVWSWRYHPSPVDYWRFSPECLKFLFKNFACIVSDFGIDAKGPPPKQGRRRIELGGRGWLENWPVYFVGKKNL